MRTILCTPLLVYLNIVCPVHCKKQKWCKGSCLDYEDNNNSIIIPLQASLCWLIKFIVLFLYLRISRIHTFQELNGSFSKKNTKMILGWRKTTKQEIPGTQTSAAPTCNVCQQDACLQGIKIYILIHSFCHTRHYNQHMSKFISHSAPPGLQIAADIWW